MARTKQCCREIPWAYVEALRRVYKPCPGGWVTISDEEAKFLLSRSGYDVSKIRSIPVSPSTCYLHLGTPVTHILDQTHLVSVLQTLYLSGNSSSESSSDTSYSPSVDMTKSQQPRGHEEASTSRPAVSKSKSGAPPAREWVNQCRDHDLEQWRAAYGFDESEYRSFIPHPDCTLEDLRNNTGVVGFYLTHFEAGLRLPVDPFIAEFLSSTQSVPLDLTFNTMLALVSFTAICRALCCEPTLTQFHEFFTFSLMRGKIQARPHDNRPHFLSPFFNKYGGWDSKVIMVESAKGWNFRVPRSPCTRWTCARGTQFAGDIEIQKAIHSALEVDATSISGKTKPVQKWVFD